MSFEGCLQWDQIGLFLKGLDEKFSHKGSPKFVTFQIKAVVAPFWATFVKNGLVIPTSGHTARRGALNRL